MDRRLWLGTALGAGAALGSALPVLAQPAPNARPVGGSVVAGAATIAQSSNVTTIDQTTQRAAINWQSFNIGSQQTVHFDQPSSSAMALNRVVGPNPSEIAGRIDANGQVVLTNQSGVMFYKGSQVNTAGLMVSAAGISNGNFMAGKMVFDQAAKPNARVANQGTITVRNAGLAALVAPQVANSGVINAQLGHVVLAGAQKATLDLYGDGLMAIDVTGQVVQAPNGATALVTNTGLIRADGGTVQLTAQAADGIVQALVNAGGRVQANSVGDRTGTVVMNGVGGSITVAGQLTATGNTTGSVGGNIQVSASGSVTLATTARVNASGQAGGGTIAIGTTLARARGGRSVTATQTAANTTVAAGATIVADAITKGDGGRVAVLSRGTTVLSGSISAKGGPNGGNGGFIETSGQTLKVGQTATVDTLAPHGQTGIWLLDPTNFTIANSGGDETPTQVVNALVEDRVFIQADNDITVADAIDATTNPVANNSLIFEAGRNIAINANIKLNGGSSNGGSFFATANDSFNLPGTSALPDRGVGPGSFTMASGVTIDTSVGAHTINIYVGPSATNTGGGGNFLPGAISLTNLSTGGGQVNVDGGSGITLGGVVTAGAGIVELFTNGASGIALNGPVTAASLLMFTNTGGVTQNAAGIVTAAALGVESAGSVNLAAANAVGTIAATVSDAGSSFLFQDAKTPLTVGTVAIPTDNPTFIVGITTNDGRVALSTTGSGNITVNQLVSSTGGEIDIAVAPGSRFINDTIGIGTNFQSSGTLDSGGGNIVILADAMTFTPASAVNTGAGTVVLGPATTTENIVLGAASSTGTLGLQSSDLATITAGMIEVGYRAEDATTSFSGNISIGGTAGISLNPALDPALLLVTGGATGTVTQTQPLNFSNFSGTLGIIAGGDVTLNGANSVNTLAGFTDNGSSFSFNANGGLTVGALPGQQLGVAVDGTTGLASSAVMATGTGKPSNPLSGVTASSGGNIALSTTNGDLTLEADVTASGQTVALNPGGQIFQNAGVVTAGTLTGSSVRGATLTQSNAVDVLGPFTDVASDGTNGITFTDGQALKTAGTVKSDGQITLATTKGDITLGGNVTSINNITTLNAAGAISQNAGIVTAEGLAITAAGPVTLLDANAVQGLTASVSGSGNGVSFRDDSTPLIVDGITTNDGRIALATTTSGSVTVNSQIASNGAEIDIAVAPGSAFITNTNTFAPLASGLLSKNGNIVILADQMTLNALVNAGTGTVVLGPSTPTDNIVLGTISSPGTLGLQTSDFNAIRAGMVEVGYRAEDGSPSFTGSIGIGGPAGVTLNAADVPTLLLVTGGTGAVTQAEPLGFSGTGGTLGIITDNNVSLTGANGVATVAGFADDGSSFSFNNAQALTVGAVTQQQLGVAIDSDGLVSSQPMASGSGNPGNPLVGVVATGGGNISISTTAGGLTLADDVTAAGQIVTLNSAGQITQTGGLITAGTLTGGSVGGASLTLVNEVGTLGPFSDSGTGNTTGLSFTDGQALTTTGTVSSTGPLALTTTKGGLTLGGDVTATGQIVTLTAAGAIDQTGGVITAATLTGSSIDGAKLTDGNAVGTLGPFSDTGADNTIGLSFTNGQALTTTGTVSSTGPLALTTTKGNLTLGGAVAANGQTVALNSAGTITQTAGGTLTPASITAATLTGSSVGGATLILGIAVGTLGPFSDTGADNTTGLTFTDGQALQTAGLVSSTGPLSLTTTKGNLTLGGDVTANGQAVTLTSAGAIDQTEGLITAATLTGSSVGGATLTDANAVGTLGPFSDSGTGNTVGLSFTDGQALTTTGLVSSTGPLALTTTEGNLVLGGAVTATGQTVALNSAGTITQTAGGTLTPASITAATLTGSSVEGATLTLGIAVDTLGPFSDTGADNTTGLTFTDGQALQTAGLVSSTGPLRLTTTKGGLTLGGDVTANGQVVTLDSAGAITQTAGSITAATLTGSSIGGAKLTDGNAVGTLGPFSDTGAGNTVGLSFTDGQALQTAGTISSTGPLALTTTKGNLTLGGEVTANGQTVALTAAGMISQTAGLITAGTLTGSSVGGATLNLANAVGTLGPFSDTGTGNTTGLTFTDGQALQTAGRVSSTGPLTLTTTVGSLTLGGDVSANNQTVTLASAGAIDQTAGVITAGTLTGHSAGDTTLGQRNDIGTLGAFTVNGDTLVLYDGAALTISGPVTANFLTITAAGRMTLAGNITTIGAPLAQQSGPDPAPQGSTLQVVPLATDPGSIAQFVQTGTVLLTDPAGATLRIQLPATGGTATFADLSGPGANLVLALGSGGTATGHMDLGGLLVIGAGGGANLLGSIDGVTTQAAAALGRIVPAIDQAYTFNDCTIGVLVCGAPIPPLLPPVVVSPELPLPGEVAWFYPGPGLVPVPPLPILNLIVLNTPALLTGELAPQDVVPPNISFEDY